LPNPFGVPSNECERRQDIPNLDHRCKVLAKLSWADPRIILTDFSAGSSR